MTARPISVPRSREMFGNVSATAILTLVAIHIVLGLAMNAAPEIATVHAIVVVLAGCCFAAFGKSLEWPCYASAYVVGSEVLWRMMHAAVFWEFGKYACCAIWLVALWRMPRRTFDTPGATYFGLLLPSIALTLVSLDISRAREEISFNLSGPLCLAIGVWFFGHVSGQLVRLDRVFLALIAPATSTAFVTAYRTVTAPTIQFGGNSNFATSGGFGPNQVAAVLGLAVFLCCFWVLYGNPRMSVRLVLISLLLFFGVQSAMTFSRGGLYGAGGAILLSCVYLFKVGRQRLTPIIALAALGLLITFVVLPRLDEFTAGRLSARFRQTRLTHRDAIIEADLRVWGEHPIFGVGPGVAKYARGLSIGAPAAHTEISRLLSEHGLFGLAALVLLIMMARKNLLLSGSPQGRALVLGVTGWAFLFMLANGMRLAAPAMVFAIASARWEGIKQPRRWRVVSRPTIASAMPVRVAL
jgi:hypothetical protein